MIIKTYFVAHDLHLVSSANGGGLDINVNINLEENEKKVMKSEVQ